jgi:ankyrin repeat protein
MGCSNSKEVVQSEKPLPAPEMVPVVVESAPREINFKPIHSAVRWNKPIEDIESLVFNADAANCVDSVNGNRPIHIAAQNGHFEVLQLLLNKGAELNAKNVKGNTAIHMAVGYDYYECAMLLIEAGADPLLPNEAGFPANTGIDGDKTLGLAALACAKNAEDVAYAFDLCEERIDEVNKSHFVAFGMKTKKSLGPEWKQELQDRLKAITLKLK